MVNFWVTSQALANTLKISRERASELIKEAKELGLLGEVYNEGLGRGLGYNLTDKQAGIVIELCQGKRERRALLAAERIRTRNPKRAGKERE